jgi:hypothetical protein
MPVTELQLTGVFGPPHSFLAKEQSISAVSGSLPARESDWSGTLPARESDWSGTLAGVGTMQQYETIPLTCDFIDADGNAADPTSVNLVLIDPAGNSLSYIYPTDISQTVSGSYKKTEFGYMAGEWSEQWIGNIASEPFIVEGTFTLTASPDASANGKPTRDVLSVIRGDDYGDSALRSAFEWHVPLAVADLTGATAVTLTVRKRHLDDLVFSVSGTVEDEGLSTQTIKIPIAGSDTITKPIGDDYKYDIEVEVDSVTYTVKVGPTQRCELVEDQTR